MTMTRDEVVKAVRDRYDSLKGFTSPDDIAATLKRHNVKGYTNCPSACAITNYLIVDVDSEDLYLNSVAVRTSAIASSIYFNIGSSVSGREPVVLMTTDAMREFIFRFDDYKYPELVIEDNDGL